MGVDKEVAKKTLHSLACGKNKVLFKTGSAKAISTNDMFNPSTVFKSRQRRFGIPMAPLGEEKARAQVDQDLVQQRGFELDAAIVRIMKSRKRLSHADLIGEVMAQIRNFVPQNRIIRTRIEGLIEREYLQRDESDNKFYIYLP